MHGAEKKTYHDSTGDPFAVMSCRTEDFLFLLEMYDTFMPEPVAQGRGKEAGPRGGPDKSKGRQVYFDAF